MTEKDRPFALIDGNGFRRALLALADNALAHTPAGGHIEITTAVLGSRAVVTVSDSGAGIKGVDQARIFDRFVRTHSPESQNQKGQNPERAVGQRSFGIGLALVREIITGAGGTVGVERSGPRGTIMKITLPLAPNNPDPKGGGPGNASS
ncbi:sensor histidine kinase [Arthrobacter sp. MMS24-S77]